LKDSVAEICRGRGPPADRGRVPYSLRRADPVPPAPDGFKVRTTFSPLFPLKVKKSWSTCPPTGAWTVEQTDVSWEIATANCEKLVTCPQMWLAVVSRDVADRRRLSKVAVRGCRQSGRLNTADNAPGAERGHQRLALRRAAVRRNL